jgi:membrane-associated phospholipid phosphatase
MRRLFDHIHATWGNWWPLLLLPTAYAAAMFAIGDLRWEHILIAVLVLGLGCGPRLTREFVVLVYPGILVALGYDVLRYLRPIFVTPERVFGCSLRDFELKLFAVAPNTTLADFFNQHHSKFFDLLFAIPYGIFFYVVIFYSVYLYIKDKDRLRWFLWAFAFAHVIAFSMWLATPAAPPWYIRAYGCMIDTNIPPSAAALLRVDDLLGMRYFETFYARGPTAFGALPSMHCAFPMIGLLTAWRAATWRTWPIHIAYAGLMIAASVYLDHHWLVDGLLGWLVALVSVLAARTVLRTRRIGGSPA